MRPSWPCKWSLYFVVSYCIATARERRRMSGQPSQQVSLVLVECNAFPAVLRSTTLHCPHS